MKAQLDRDYGWKGQLYSAGETEIPDDLAEAIGLTPSPAQTQEVEQSSTEGQDEEPPQTIAINTATAEAIADGLSGVGLTTAKEVVKLRESLPEKRFTDIEQLGQISRVDWKALTAQISFD